MTTTGIIQFLIIYGVSKMAIGKGIVTSEEQYDKYLEVCKNFSRNSFFENERVIGRSWRIHYIWNTKLDFKCMDIVFKKASKEIIHRVWSDMNEYLEHQPNWSAATLLLFLGTSRYEILLFADQGPAGSFIAVPNVVRDGNIAPLRKTIPLFKFHMKLIRGGKYLVVMDCTMGITYLAARQNEVATSPAEIASAAADLELGQGFPVCTKEKNNEDFLV